MANNITFPGDPHRYPNYFHHWNRAHAGAYKKGVRAFKEGRPRSANPYGDQRNWHGGVTWARAFWKNWDWGWENAQIQNREPQP
jgi:hypothetical protein